MSARRLMFSVSICVCALSLVLMAGVGLASAATQFGSYGPEAEQFELPAGVAVDATGNVYVGDQNNNRLDKFNGAGDWEWASGAGVLNGASEMQTCTSSCQGGLFAGAPEALANDGGVAVDNDPLSSSYGDVYVLDEEHSRVEKFDATGEFLLTFGGEVNETTGGDVCRAGEKCKLDATNGGANGEFSYMLSPYGVNSFIAVGPTGEVYVGDEGRVEVFESSGVWKENISLTGLSTEARPTALAVDSAGDIFLKDGGVPGVREFEPDGTEMSTRFDGNSTTVTAIALDPSSGHVFVGDSSGEFHILEYDSNGKELAGFAAKTVNGENRGLAFSDATGELYAPESYKFDVSSGNGFVEEKYQASIWVISPPAPGPTVEGESATPELQGASTLEAQVNPEGDETTVRFEYVDEADFKASGYASATSTSPVIVGSTPSFEDQTVTAHPELVPGTVYHYRVVATNSNGTASSEGQSFQEIPPALILGPWTTNVAGTSVTIDAEIDPQGTSTTYRLEYGTSLSYGHVFSGSVGEGSGYVTISRHIQELEPLTTYHYRIVTNNEVGTWQSPDHTFTTQAETTGEVSLPDGRAWELVTPPNKHGALIEPELIGLFGEMQAASDGSGIAYMVNEPISEKAPASYGAGGDQAFSVRSSDGWHTQEVGAPVDLTENLYNQEEVGEPTFAILFSSDLSQVVMEPGPYDLQSLSPEATERTLYLHDNTTGKYVPLVTPANVPAGAKIGAETVDGETAYYQQMVYLGATPDLSHIVFQSPRRLTPEAVEGTGGSEGHAGCDEPRKTGCPQNLYEWSAGRLSLVDILPDGTPLRGEEGNGAYLGRSSQDTLHAISNDGRRIVWSHGSLQHSRTNTLYVRDMVEGKTRQMGGPGARFEMMSEDGSTVFYWENSELYAYDIDAETTTNLTKDHAAGEHNGGVKDGFVMDASEDGSYI